MTHVVVRCPRGLTQTISMRDHQLRADEPHSAGGDDVGPTPYELLLAALGACTAMTVRMYAERKGYPLESIEVVLEHDRLHAVDCAECETREGYLDRIRKQLVLTGPLSAEHIQRLHEIADRCPVQRTLQREIIIETADPAQPGSG